MQIHPLSLLLLLLVHLILPTRGSYLLVAVFHTYKNLPHSYLNTSSSPFEPQCCDGREFLNCTDPCNTILNYCFKEAGTINNFSDDDNILDECIDDTRSLTELMQPMDDIDFSDPPLTISDLPTWSSVGNRGDYWPGGIQFLVRSAVNTKIVDYLYDDIYLTPGQNITNRIFYGKYFGENVTFVASFHLSCTFNFYGENCDVFCSPSNNTEDGCYECDSNGTKVCECAPGYYSGPYCTRELDICSRLEPCMEGNCTNTGPDSYHCECYSGYEGVNCTDNTVPDLTTTYALVIAGGVVGLLAPVVLLSPLIIILCFTALGSWKKKKNEYVNNPLYGESTTAPSSASNTFRSEVDTSTTYGETDTTELQGSDSGTDTQSTSKKLDDGVDPGYDILPAEQDPNRGRGLSAYTFGSDDNNSYYTMSISTAESVCPYNYLPDNYDVPPPLPEHGLPPSIPNSFYNAPEHSFLAETTISMEEVPSHHPLDDQQSYFDIVPADNNGTVSIRPSLPKIHHHHGVQRSNTFGSKGRHPNNPRRGHNHSDLFKDHRPLTKSASLECAYRRFPDHMRFMRHYSKRRLPAVPPPHGLHHSSGASSLEQEISHARFVSLDENESLHHPPIPRIAALQGEASCSTTFLTNSTSKRSDSTCSNQSMGTRELPGPYHHRDQLPVTDDLQRHDYDEVARDDYDVPRNRTGYERYDVPRKDESSA